MSCYSHALVLVHDRKDGIILLNHAVRMAESLGIKVTLAHISDDYREMNYVSDSLMDDVVSKEVIQAKALLDELANATDSPVEVRQLVTMHRIEDVEKCITDLNVDLVIAGHRNRFMGLLTSHSIEYINRLTVDILIKHTNA